MKTFTTPKDSCPICNAKVDRATNPNGKDKPVAGDYSICFKCATILCFDKNLHLQKLPNEQLQKVRSEFPELFDTMMQIVEEIRKAER